MVMPKPFLVTLRLEVNVNFMVSSMSITKHLSQMVSLVFTEIKSKLTPFHKQSGYDRISDKLQSLHLNLKSIQSIYFNNNDFRNQIIDKKKFTQHLLSGWKLYPGYYSIFKLSKL
ncbi:unnamed protein product [Rhizophagus irregularis]|uniref:Uncharacterized protein n=1 Tax=Rhizophagus irregularis TaxID=588596 RepID=A0A915ZFV1_9GLOM|nr:unnamed protein product [Rhizophagus irregularis]